MKIKKLIEDFGFKLVTDNSNLEKEISGIRCCDLLSWVMANGKVGEAWITVQTHCNIVAVAILLGMSCIIIPSSIEVDKLTLKKANEQGLSIFSTDEDAYGIFKLLYGAGI